MSIVNQRLEIVGRTQRRVEFCRIDAGILRPDVVKMFRVAEIGSRQPDTGDS